MFGIGTSELVVIIIVALIVIGPSKLPELMRTLGRGLAEFRRMSTDVHRTLEREVEKADADRRKEEVKKELFPDAGPAPAPPAQTQKVVDVQAAGPVAPQAAPSIDKPQETKADKA